MNCDYDIRITSDKEIWNKNEMIAKLEIKSLQDYLDEAKANVASERRKHPLWWLWYDLKLWFLRSVNNLKAIDASPTSIDAEIRI